MYETVTAPGKGFVHGFTYSHAPIGAAVASEVLRILRDESPGRGERDEGRPTERRCCAARLEEHPAVGDIRGRGLMVGVELVADRATRRPFPRAARVAEGVVAAARERGVLVYSGTGNANGVDGDTILLGPPFVITDAELQSVADVMTEAIDVATASVARDLRQRRALGGDPLGLLPVVAAGVAAGVLLTLDEGFLHALASSGTTGSPQEAAPPPAPLVRSPVREEDQDRVEDPERGESIPMRPCPDPEIPGPVAPRRPTARRGRRRATPQRKMPDPGRDGPEGDDAHQLEPDDQRRRCRSPGRRTPGPLSRSVVVRIASALLHGRTPSVLPCVQPRCQGPARVRT